jgi:pimeloyl-ACP methyl ester carboxylesterase
VAEILNEDGRPIEISGVTLRTPGLRGTVEVYRPVGGEARSLRDADHTEPLLARALLNARTTEQMSIVLTDTREVPGFDGEARRDASGDPAIEVTVPAPGEDVGQFILATDETGLLSWHVARDADNAIQTTRGGDTRTYVIPRSVYTEQGSLETRGLVSSIAKKILKVIIFPIFDPFLGEVGEHFAGEWERHNRAHGIRTFTPANYTSAAGETLGAQAWPSLRGKRSLLFVHGTFSRASSAFGGIAPSTMETLFTRYGGRVFAFDHPTMTETPAQNVDWLLRQIPSGADLDVDIVCHSRGGLVSRELARRQGMLANGAKLRAGRIIFVAAPNAGTILTNAEHVSDFLDAYTNILNLFPDNAVLDVLDAILAIVKQFAAATLTALDGLQSMLPGGPVLKDLDAVIPKERQYYAVASNFAPSAGSSLAVIAADKLLDKVFQSKRNDCVVPTDGVYTFGANDGGFGPDPAKRLYVFDGPGAPVHTRLFQEPATNELLLRWLEG